MLRAPYFTHSPFAEPLDQIVAAQFARAAHFRSERVNDTRTHVRHDHDEDRGRGLLAHSRDKAS